MGTFSYENQGTNTYLVYALEENEVIDTMSLGMITNNSILGLAPAQYTQMNTSRYIRYNISSKITMKDFFAGPVNRKRLLGVFNGIVNAMLSAEDYMIDTNAVIVDPLFIFSDVTTCETVLICIPVLGMSQGDVDFGNFFKNIMFSTQFDQTESYGYVGEIISFLNRISVFSLLEFKTVLDNIVRQSLDSAQQVQQVSRENLQFATQEENLRSSPQPKTSVQLQNDGSMNGVKQVSPVSSSLVQPRQQAPIMPSVNPPAEEQKVDKDEKKISMFYLLQHYNKENAELYKAQKAAHKSKKGSKETSKQDAVKPVGKTPQRQPGYAVPGQQQTPTGFAVPGQQSNLQGFSIPESVQSHISQPTPDPHHSVSQPSKKELLNQTPATHDLPSGLNIDFGDTVIEGVYDGDSETVILGQDSMKQHTNPHLIRKKNNEKILINKALFRLGRDTSFNDYIITDNKFIGHGHCHIITREGEYFIVDDNSKNHTYVDGTAIPPSSEVKLSHGQNVRLSNEEFEFRLF